MSLISGFMFQYQFWFNVLNTIRCGFDSSGQNEAKSGLF